MNFFRLLVLVFIVNVALVDAHPINEVYRTPVALTHIAVIDAANASLERDMTVVIVGDHIANVGMADEIKVPSTAQVIDGRGLFLMPGLCDMHVHVFNHISRRPPNTDIERFCPRCRAVAAVSLPSHCQCQRGSHGSSANACCRWLNAEVAGECAIPNTP